MSKVYGTLRTEKGGVTRQGNQYVTATAQSYEGSVSVSIKWSPAGNRVELRAEKGSTATPGHLFWNGDLTELVSAMLTLKAE